MKSLNRVQLFETPWTVAYYCSSVHGIFQARVLEWVAISFSRGSSWPRDRTQVSRTVGRRFTVWATRDVSGMPMYWSLHKNLKERIWRVSKLKNMWLCKESRLFRWGMEAPFPLPIFWPMHLFYLLVTELCPFIINWESGKKNVSVSYSSKLNKPAAAAAAANLLQSCPTLCDSIDGSPPGSPVPGILQARTLEWVAISFSNAWKWKVKMRSLSRVRFLATPWTAAYQAPPSMGFSRQEYWTGVPLPSPKQT